MSLNCISLITATLVMNIKRLSYLEPPPEVPKRLLYFCENYLSKIICARMSDWKRIASNPEDRLLSHEKKSKRVQLLSTVDSFVMTDKSDSAHAQYVQLQEFPSDNSMEDTYTPEQPRRKHNQTKHAIFANKKSTYRYSNNNGNFIEEASYTDKLLLHRPSEISVLSRLENVNHSFQDDDSDCEETSFSPGFSGHRSSYRKAIRSGQQHSNVCTDKQVSDTNSNKQSVIACISRKYQWYFVADVIDTITFLFYIFTMFLAIFSVLVVTPLFA
jgi:hypothetical protein